MNNLLFPTALLAIAGAFAADWTLAQSPGSFDPPRYPVTGAQPPPQKPDLFEPAQIVAFVGGKPILAGDLLGQINQVLEKYEGRIPKEELKQQRTVLMKQLLDRTIETKLLYHDFIRTVPPDKLPELEKNVRRHFDQTQLEPMMKKFEVNTPAELDAILRQYGSSLTKTRRAFAEQVLAKEMLRRNVDFDQEVTHEEMLARYREHAEDYECPAQARWEQLMVQFSNDHSKDVAYNDIAGMGNQVLRGAQLSAVARRSQQGPHADQGGLHDWTNQGSLRSDVLDRAIFSLPVGRLSQIIEDEHGFHIIRVLERRDASRVPFTEAQVEIKEKIRKERTAAQMQAYLADLRQDTRVWTIFDQQNTEQRVSQTSGSASRYGQYPR